MQHNTQPNIEADRQLIEQLGGSTRLAQELGFKQPGGAQRVNNWKLRGIPPSVKLSRPDLFLRHIRKKRNKK